MVYFSQVIKLFYDLDRFIQNRKNRRIVILNLDMTLELIFVHFLLKCVFSLNAEILKTLGTVIA